MLHDLRHALRALAQAKGTTAVLLLSVALGTGVNAAVYGALDALLLRAPAGVADASRLVEIFTTEFSGSPYGLSSVPDFLSMASVARTVSSVAAVDDRTVENVGAGAATRRARVARVSDTFFGVLKMTLAAGRSFTPAERASAARVAVVSASLADDLGADAVLGRTLTIGSADFLVIGIASERFRGLRAERECDVWIPLSEDAESRGDRRLAIVGRLASGETLASANDELGRLSNGLANRFPETNRGTIRDPHAPRLIAAVRYTPLNPAMSQQIVLIGFVVGGASALLLASACLNLGSLLLTRAAARRQEFAIKLALGATRGRLVRRLLVESSCAALGGGALGLLFAVWTSGALPALFLSGQAELLDTSLDVRAMLATVAVGCAAAALFGIAPAIQGTASPAIAALRGDPGGVSSARGRVAWRATLVMGQVAVSAALVIAASVLVTGMRHALEGELDATVRHVDVVSLELPGRFADTLRGTRARDALMQQVAKVPGVAAVAWANSLPLGGGNRGQFRIAGPTGEVMDTLEFDTNTVSTDYFRVLSLPIVEGRAFDDRDGALATPVVLVDELLARRYFGARAVNRQLIDEEGEPLTIVGVVRAGTYRTLQQAPQATVYFPVAQDYLWRGQLLVRASSDPAVLLPILDRALEGGDATVLRASTFEDRLTESLALERLTTVIVSVWSLVALAMAAIGVYGVMSDAVRRRTREIGLRMALGAGPHSVAVLVLTDAAVLTGAGLAVGAGVALAVDALARTFVDGVPRLDLAVLLTAAAALTAAVAAAAAPPLIRALRVNPAFALRAE